MDIPDGLEAGGQALWDAIVGDHELDATQAVQLEEACRAKDRLDRLNQVLTGESETWMRLVHNTRTEDYELKIDGVLAAANATANLMKQLLAALRLPDAQTGKKPQFRGPRGAQRPTVPGGTSGKVSSLDRARDKKLS